MYDMLSRPWRGASNQKRQERRLAVVQASLGDDADEDIVIQVDRVTARRWFVAAEPAKDRPRAAAQKILARHRRERRLNPTVGNPGRRHDLLGVGPPDDFQLCLLVHQLRPARATKPLKTSDENLGSAAHAACPKSPLG